MIITVTYIMDIHAAAVWNILDYKHFLRIYFMIITKTLVYFIGITVKSKVIEFISKEIINIIMIATDFS